MRSIVIIPARYGSIRFPGKPLAPLLGIPVIQHVYENARKAHKVHDILVATDHDAIYEAVLSFGGNAVMTSHTLASGTDRVAEVAKNLDYDIIVNVQGDEPLINGGMIDTVIDLLRDPQADMGTLIKKIDDHEEYFDPNVVKAVFDPQGYALYFSRAPIPFSRDEISLKNMHNNDHENPSVHSFSYSSAGPVSAYKHIGMYSYRKDVLMKLTALSHTSLEETEKLEQLRAMEHGLKIKIEETSYETIGVDTPQDLEKVEKWLNLSS